MATASYRSSATSNTGVVSRPADTQAGDGEPTGAWTLNTQGLQPFNSAAYGNGYWVAVGNSGTVYCKTTNPESQWTLNKVSTTNYTSVAYGWAPPTGMGEKIDLTDSSHGIEVNDEISALTGTRTPDSAPVGGNGTIYVNVSLELNSFPTATPRGIPWISIGPGG